MGVKTSTSGFTLIELSIVLVIIGLIVGGVLMGRDLIAASEIRAQIAQIEKYNTAVHTFRGKYGGLPGDLRRSAQFGFTARDGTARKGDGNGVLEGPSGGGGQIGGGEGGLFWEDLSAAHLIEGSFTLASPDGAGDVGPDTGGNIGDYLPQAKIGHGNYVYAWSGGWVKKYCTGWPCGNDQGDGKNYYGLAAVTELGGNLPASVPGLTVQQAYNIDKKMDDGLPQSGSVIALYLEFQNGATWALGGASTCSTGGGTVPCAAGVGDNDPSTGGPVTTGSGVATTGSITTCYDNGGVTDAPEQYSLAQGSGAMNCALSFRFQ